MQDTVFLRVSAFTVREMQNIADSRGVSLLSVVDDAFNHFILNYQLGLIPCFTQDDLDYLALQILKGLQHEF